MSRTLFSSIFVGCIVCLTAWPAELSAAETPPLPRDPAVWINSAPITLEQVRGKAVFLWFFEETCPTCRAKWPGLLEKAREYKDKPILFVAVNSGTSPASVLEYARLVNCPWPILADVDRSFEKASDVGEISLDNICQVCWIAHDGVLHDGDWSEIDTSIKGALDGAAWKVDPAEIPAEVRDTWRALEFGNYKAAAPGLKKSLGSPKREIKEAGEKLRDLVQEEIKGQLDVAKQAQDAGQFWKAFEICQLITNRFNGMELPPELGEIKKAVQKETQVKSGIMSRKVLDSTLKTLNSGRPLSKKSRTQIEKIINDFPESEMAREAQQVVEQADKTNKPQTKE